ncbi:hypothetical protein HMI55_004173 [Coelomomyces lativittatus]|nr:hypothetical protein HMI55_004173 [Coelomomyces lativittatus]
MSQCANLPNDVEVDTEDTWLPKYALNIGLGSYFMEHLNALLQSIPMKDPQRETYFKAMVHEIHCFQALCDAGKDHFDLDTIKDETIETIANLSLTDDKTFLSLSPSENNSQTTELLRISALNLFFIPSKSARAFGFI